MPAAVQSSIRKRRVAGRPQLERETPLIAQAAARLQEERPEWFARLPQDYVWGGVELTGRKAEETRTENHSPALAATERGRGADDRLLSVEARSLWGSF